MQSNTQMPHDIFAEMSVLGAILYDPNLILSEHADIEPDDFYDRRHQEVYRAMLMLTEDNKHIDMTTLTDQLKEMEQFNFVGAPKMLVDLLEAAPSIRNFPEYVDIVRKYSLRRRLIFTAEGIIKESLDDTSNVEDLLTDAERKIMNVSENNLKSDFKSMRDITQDMYGHIEAINKQDGGLTGIATGYRDLDNMTGGFSRNDLIIIAARPSMGKTAFALNIAEHVGHGDTNQVVAIFSLEMGAEQLVTRMIASSGMISATKLRRGNFDKDDWRRFTLSMRKLSESRIFIDDSPGIRINELRSKCLRLKQQQGALDMIIVDYLQLIQGSSTRKNDNRQQEVSEISRMLKGIAREIGCPVVALSQLSRGVETRQDKRPMMSDLRESGSIEQDADIVSFLYRDDYYNRGDGENGEEGAQLENSEVEIIIAKHRNGPTGAIKLIFNKTYSKFLDQENFSRDD